MKFCPNCGNKLQPGDRFCEKCGYQVAEPQEEKPKVTKPVSQSQPATDKKASAPVQDQEKKAVKVAPTPAKKNNKPNTGKDKLADLKNKVNMDKLQSQINKDPKKAGILGGVILVVVIALGVAIHMIQLQPDHALVNKPYRVTVTAKTTSQGFFTTHTENTTNSYYIYLDKHRGKLYMEDSADNVKQAAKNDSDGTDYTLEDSTLKIPLTLILGYDLGNEKGQIEDIHRTKNGYTGTIKALGDDSGNITGTVTFKKA